MIPSVASAAQPNSAICSMSNAVARTVDLVGIGGGASVWRASHSPALRRICSSSPSAFIASIAASIAASSSGSCLRTAITYVPRAMPVTHSSPSTGQP